MHNLKNKLVKEAENLKAPKKFLFFFTVCKPDYESAADKYKEASMLCQDKNEKIKYLKEAANTYLLNPVEYNRYNAYLLYQDIAEICSEEDECIEYYIKSGDMAMSCDKESLAAKSYEKAAEICTDKNKKIDLLSRIVKCYSGSTWKYHRTNALKNLAFALYNNKEYEKAATNFILINTSVYNLCAAMCYHMIGVDTDLEVSDEYKGIYDSLSKTPEDLKKSIELFLENNAIEKEVKIIMKDLVSRMAPENDIL